MSRSCSVSSHPCFGDPPTLPSQAYRTWPTRTLPRRRLAAMALDTPLAARANTAPAPKPVHPPPLSYFWQPSTTRQSVTSTSIRTSLSARTLWWVPSTIRVTVTPVATKGAGFPSRGDRAVTRPDVGAARSGNRRSSSSWSPERIVRTGNVMGISCLRGVCKCKTGVLADTYSCHLVAGQGRPRAGGPGVCPTRAGGASLQAWNVRDGLVLVAAGVPAVDVAVRDDLHRGYGHVDQVALPVVLVKHVADDRGLAGGEVRH